MSTEDDCQICGRPGVDHADLCAAPDIASIVLLLRRAVANWQDYTSQEMYGEALRATLSISDFERWDDLHAQMHKAIALYDQGNGGNDHEA